MEVSDQTITNWWHGHAEPKRENLELYVSKVLRISMSEFYGPVPGRKAS